jgi:pimeloyl-ACP methyl ester carboxylesterase
MAYAKHRISTADGLKIYARDYAAAGAPRGLPVLCLHGLTRSSTDFEIVAPRIAALGRRVIAIDTRGRGLSDYDPDPTRYRADVYVADTLRVLDELGIAHAVFLGTSMGGIVTMLTAVMARERIAAAVLNDIGPEIDPAGVARIASYVGKSGPFADWDEMIAAVRTSQGAAFPGKDENFWRNFAHRVARAGPDGRIGFAYDPAIAQAFASTPSPPPNMLPLFEALAGVPILLIRGASSDLLSLKGVATMRRVKPNLEFVEVPNVGHAPMLDEPEAWDAIARFLGRVP